MKLIEIRVFNENVNANIEKKNCGKNCCKRKKKE